MWQADRHRRWIVALGEQRRAYPDTTLGTSEVSLLFPSATVCFIFWTSQYSGQESQLTADNFVSSRYRDPDGNYTSLVCVQEGYYYDKTKLYLCTVSQMIYMASEFEYTLKRHTGEKYIQVISMGKLFMSEQHEQQY